MENLYVAINADNAGEKVSKAVLDNNTEDLKNVSGNIKQSQSLIEQWIQAQGGEVFASAGDEILALVPAQANFDEIKQQYEQSSGNTLTIGIGDNLTNSLKALIYGKLNGKNQVVQYTPEVEQFLESMNGGGQQNNTQEQIGNSEQIPTKDEVGQPRLPTDTNTTQQLPPKNVPMTADQMPPKTSVSDMPSPMTALQPTPKTSEVQKPIDNSNAPAQTAGGAITPNSKNEAQNTAGAVPQQNAAQKPMQKEVNPAMATNNDENNKSTEQKPAQENKNVAIQPNENKEEDNNVDNTLENDDDSNENEFDNNNENTTNEENEEETDGDEDNGDDYDVMSEMIYGHMQDGNEQDDDYDSIKNTVMQALQAFKTHKASLTQIEQTNPELYEATINMIQSMINMAKQLNTADGDGEEGEAEIEELDSELEGDPNEENTVEHEANETPEQEAVEEKNKTDKKPAPFDKGKPVDKKPTDKKETDKKKSVAPAIKKKAINQ